jgi:uncharacterized membrane protein (GlpM family)
MQIFIKAAISIAVIFLATGIGKKFPSVAGLVAVMPLTGALVLIWVSVENKGNQAIMQSFTKGALFGIIPTVLFFCVAFICFKKGLSLPVVLGASFGTWLMAAFAHQWLLK